MDFWELAFWGSTTRAWLIALGVTIGVMAIFWALRRFLIRYFRRLVSRTETGVDDLVAEVSGKTKFWLLAIVALYIGSRMLSLPAPAQAWAQAVMVIAFLIQVALWGDALLRGWLLRYQQRQGEDEAAEVTTVKVATVVVRFSLFILIGLIALDNIPGVEVTTLIASLGIGGIAVALAVQNILGDLFASLIIVLDRPFVIGDLIKVGDYLGTVEAIGLKTTRVRSYTGEEVVFGNSDLLGSRLSNYRTLAKRLVIASISVTCETPHEKLERIPAMLQEIVEAQENAQFARAHLSDFGASSYDYQMVYSTLSPDFGLYMDTKQAVNLGIIQRFEAEGIEMPYPTQVVYVSDGGKRS